MVLHGKKSITAIYKKGGNNMRFNKFKCCICGKEVEEYGNNPWPIKEGRCCNECNLSKVLPARIEMLRKENSHEN